MKRVLFASLALALAGCADSSDEIAASYVSPLAYQDYTCRQLGAEVGRVSSRAAEVAGIQDEASSDDAAVMAIGTILFWPALFFLEGDTGREAELARLRGEIDAVERAAIQKDCAAVATDLAEQRELAEAERKRRKEESGRSHKSRNSRH